MNIFVSGAGGVVMGVVTIALLFYALRVMHKESPPYGEC
jgi:hypothetical protein